MTPPHVIYWPDTRIVKSQSNEFTGHLTQPRSQFVNATGFRVLKTGPKTVAPHWGGNNEPAMLCPQEVA